MAPAVVETWGTSEFDGKNVQLFTLSADSGAKLKVSSYGATLVGLTVPDKAGTFDDVLLGFEDLASYERHGTYIGCAVGRICSRIAGAQFQLNDQVFRLPANNGAACHHGGPVGFNRYTWDVVDACQSSVKFRLVSADGDQGFPGRLTVFAEYALLPTKSGGTALSIGFQAVVADKPTVVNLTNHLYFNLAGHHGSMRESMYDHRVTIAADHFVPTDDINIPLGELRSVEGTPFEFRTSTRIGARIEDDDEQLRIAAGYDHNMALREVPSPSTSTPTVSNIDGKEVPSALLRGGTRALGLKFDDAGQRWERIREPDAIAEEPKSGRRVEMFTVEPAVHFYTGNYLGEEPMGKEGMKIDRRAGFCFETQHFTDSPNQPTFPSVKLEPGELWETRTVFWFPSLADSTS